MKRKNRSRFFDDDELLVADILLQIPRIIFESESRFLFNWGFRRTRSDFDRSLSSHPKRKRTKLSYEKKKEDRLTMVDGLTRQRELLKSEMENVIGLHNTLTAVKSETKLNLATAMAKAKAESGEQVHPHPQQPPPFLRRHSPKTTALMPSTSGSIVVYPLGPFVVMPHLYLSSKETLGPNLSPPLDFNLNMALYFDPTQSKRAAAAQARKKRRQIYRVKKPKAVQVPPSSLLVSS